MAARKLRTGAALRANATGQRRTGENYRLRYGRKTSVLDRAGGSLGRHGGVVRVRRARLQKGQCKVVVVAAVGVGVGGRERLLQQRSAVSRGRRTQLAAGSTAEAQSEWTRAAT